MLKGKCEYKMDNTYTALVSTDETFVKRLHMGEDVESSPIECGQRVTSFLDINISNRALINVDSENVESVFNEISNTNSEENSEATGNSESTVKLIKLFRDLPKDFFISRVMLDNSSDETTLKELRYNLF